MNKYIYHDKKLRCKISYDKAVNHYTLQLQKKKVVFWVNLYRWWMTVKDGFWGECDRFPILRSSYQYGHKSEAYRTGTLDIPKRVEEFIKEYLESEQTSVNALDRLKAI